MYLKAPEAALRTVDHIPALVAYWDHNERCVFANAAYLEWLGKDRSQILGSTLKELLGPLYEENLPYIQGVLKGERQVFERRVPRPDGAFKDCIATYTPEIIDGMVCGFSVHVADVTQLRAREMALEEVIRERDELLAKLGSVPAHQSGNLLNPFGTGWNGRDRLPL